MSYYAASAYNSSQPRYQPSQRMAPGIVGYQRLPWGSTKELMPTGLVSDLQKPFLEEVQRVASYQPDIPREQWACHNHEYIQPDNISKLSIILNVLGGAGKMLAFPAVGIVVFAFILGAITSEDTIWESFQGIFPVLFFLPGIFFYLWGIGAFLAKYFPQVFSIKGNGKIKWRLNRRTGMVSKFTYKDDKVIEQTAPFDEFDGYAFTSMSRHGYLYEFTLSHRYEGWGLDFSELGACKVDKRTARSAWDFIQNYMDTSHALPEYPVLEIYRHLDPTTVELDKQTGRNPKRWQQMTPEQWEENDNLVANPLRNNMDTRHCLFEEGGYVKYLSYCQWTPDPDYKYVD